MQVNALGPVPVKGLAEPVEVYELVGRQRRPHAPAGRRRAGLTRFVGATAELDTLRQALEQARRGHGQVVALVGEPGVGQVAPGLGVHPLAPHAGLADPGERARSRTARPPRTSRSSSCSSATSGSRTGRRAHDPREGDGQAADPGPGAGGQLSRRCSRCSMCPAEDSAWQTLDPRSGASAPSTRCKRLLLRESQVQPLLLVFEDLHWIDAETQALLDSLVESLPTARAAAAGQLPPGVPARLGQQDLLHPAADRSAAAPDERRRAARGAARRRTRARRRSSRCSLRDRGQPVLPRRERPHAGGDRRRWSGSAGRYRLARRPLDGFRCPATVQAVLAARIDRLTAGGQTACSRWRR